MRRDAGINAFELETADGALHRRRVIRRRLRPPDRLGTIPGFPETSVTRIIDIRCELRAEGAFDDTSAGRQASGSVRACRSGRGGAARSAVVRDSAAARMSHSISIIRVADVSGKCVERGARRPVGLRVGTAERSFTASQLCRSV